MTGQELKSKLIKAGKSQKDIAELLGVTAQSLSSVLSAKDVRSGTIEKIASAIGVDMSFFYPADNQKAVASGDNSVAAIQSTVTHDDGVLAAKVSLLEKLLEEKERTIQILMKK